jgi:sugar lactone lactonase YvrE
MKKIVLMFLIFTSNMLFSQDIPTLNMELAKTFPMGRGEEKLSLCLQCPSETGPSAISFDKNDNLFISDILAERLVKYDSAFNFKEEYRDGYANSANQLFISDDGEFITLIHTTIAVDDANGKKKFIVALLDSPFKNQIPSNPDFVYTDNSVYFRLKSDELININNPSKDNKKNMEKASKATQKNLNGSTNDPNKSMSGNNQNDTLKIEKLNSEDVIISDDKVKTRDFAIFNKYWKKKREEEKQLNRNSVQPSEQESNIYDLNKIPSGYFTYVGKDMAGNYYWDINWSRICVFNEKGSLIQYFRYGKNKSKVLPTIHPSGDIYFLNYDEKGVYLYKIPKTW